jgi:hypothetical protein
MSKTTHRGLLKIDASSPDYEVTGPWETIVNAALVALDAAHGAEIHTVDGAIAAKEGTVLIGGSGVSALTLAAPTAGLPSAATPGDDGKELKIMAVTTHAHTVTTPSNVLDGAHHLATFAAIGDILRLIAYNGKWYPVYSTPTNVVIS